MEPRAACAWHHHRCFDVGRFCAFGGARDRRRAWRATNRAGGSVRRTGARDGRASYGDLAVLPAMACNRRDVCRLPLRAVFCDGDPGPRCGCPTRDNSDHVVRGLCRHAQFSHGACSCRSVRLARLNGGARPVCDFRGGADTVARRAPSGERERRRRAFRAATRQSKPGLLAPWRCIGNTGLCPWRDAQSLVAASVRARRPCRTRRCRRLLYWTHAGRWAAVDGGNAAQGRGSWLRLGRFSQLLPAPWA